MLCDYPSKWRGAGLVALLALGAPASMMAQARVPDVPSAFSDAAREKLQPEHDRLVREFEQLQRASATHNERCRAVADGSPEAASCSASRDRLKTAAVALRDRMDRFQQSINTTATAELAQIDKEQASLTQQITNALDRMRALANDASEASSEQMSRLNAEVKRWIEEKRKSGVRRVAVANAVRG